VRSAWQKYGKSNATRSADLSKKMKKSGLGLFQQTCQPDQQTISEILDTKHVFIVLNSQMVVCYGF